MIQSSPNFCYRSYRLSNKRPLKELMILGKGGCDSSSPGIGDVAFVKDLMTEKIVTHSFRCSKFGIAHTSKSKIGWVSYSLYLTRVISKCEKVLSKLVALLSKFTQINSIKFTYHDITSLTTIFLYVTPVRNILQDNDT